MKKRLFLILSVIIIILFVIYNVGFRIGNVSVGKQHDEIETGNKYDLENSSFSKEFLQKGEVSVINLWASWCKPCIEEMPVFAKLEKDFPNYKFAFLSIDKNEEDLKKGIENFKVQKDITFQNKEYRKAIRNFLEDRELKSLIKSEAVPVTYIVKDGKVMYKEVGSIDYNVISQKLKSLN